MNEFAKLLSDFVKRRIPVTFQEGKVKSVSGSTCTVTPSDGGADIPDVRISALESDNNGIVSIPAKDSFCIIGIIQNDENNAFLFRAETYEKHIFKAKDGATWEANSNGEIIMNGGNLGGLVKLQQLEQNLNSIKSYLSTLNGAISAAFTAVGAGASANGASGATSFNTAMSSQQLQYTSMENTKIKQ